MAENFTQMAAWILVMGSALASTNTATNLSGPLTEQKHMEKRLNWEDVLDSWENDRNYWYMNYYQEYNQPEINGKAKVFETIQELNSSIGKKGFRCPSCGKVVNDPYECNVCGWKVYGFLGDLGKGVFVYVKEKLRGNTIFMPVSWEEELNANEKGK